MTGRVGILGGTFDPIHRGHLAAGRAAADQLGFDRLLVMPSRRPPHRPDRPAASGYHRFAMAAIAVAGEPGFEASDLELRREGPSYTFDTLGALADQGLEPSQLFFITGADAFADIATWSRYPAILDRAHFVVVTRPGTDLGVLRRRLPDLVPRMTTPAAFGVGDALAILLLEAPTPDVSSTEVRRRAGAGEPVASLLPAGVAAHITRHGLYRGAAPAPAHETRA